MGLFGTQKETQAPQELTPDIATMNDALKTHGIDVMAEKRRKDAIEEEKRSHAEAMAAMRRDEEEQQLETEKKAPGIIGEGHIKITVDGEQTRDINIPCPVCGTTLTQAKEALLTRVSRWMSAEDKIALAKSRLGWWHDESLICGKCGKHHEVFIQVII